jgi:hypothetical protein
MLSGIQVLMFQKNLLPSSSRKQAKESDNRFILNVGSCLPNYTASRYRRLIISSILKNEN